MERARDAFRTGMSAAEASEAVPEPQVESMEGGENDGYE